MRAGTDSSGIAPLPESRRPISACFAGRRQLSLLPDHISNYKCNPFNVMRVLFALHQQPPRPCAKAKWPG
jgi:hypothetical protein